MIDDAYIKILLEDAKGTSDKNIEEIIEKASRKKTLSLKEIAVLLQVKKDEHLEKIFKIANKIKHEIYGDRIVIFAPLYISNYCVNSCLYCGYKCKSDILRKKLNEEEIREEVRILEKMGHKRIALEAGEDPKNCDIDYILDSIKTIYDTFEERGNIRRINVNIAATTIENYKKLKEAGIGTYILFQETYHKDTYQSFHLAGPKSDYNYHLTAFDRAMEGGIDDVGGGVLLGLYDYKYEVLALMLHNNYLEEKYGVGFHTISVPRIKKAKGMRLEDFPYLLTDEEFKKVIAILRIAVPYTGLILSTRETKEMREEAINYGVSQVSAGSCTGIGGYKEKELGENTSQFQVGDNREPLEILKELIRNGHIPSYCTACYRKGRTGDKFMEFARTGEIKNICEPNAMMTLTEYALDYGDEELKSLVEALIEDKLGKIPNLRTRELVRANIEKIKNGKRDLYI